MGGAINPREQYVAELSALVLAENLHALLSPGSGQLQRVFCWRVGAEDAPLWARYFDHFFDFYGTEKELDQTVRWIEKDLLPRLGVVLALIRVSRHPLDAFDTLVALVNAEGDAETPAGLG